MFTIELLSTIILTGLIASLVTCGLTRRRRKDPYPVDECSWINPRDLEQAERLTCNTKLVLLVRTDLGMGKGKQCAQCGHASVRACQVAARYAPQYLYHWLNTGSKKVALKVIEDELDQLLDQAVKRGIVCGVIQDAGHTQVDPGSRTVAYIGPYEDDIIDEITGHLKLL
ncbi:Peptidyl-tRNA hydrolase [Giardia muris]|uniref:peptidyl-tRNA hydrolase n=1 Tax=Giardia muris TaxID=5742 RepID=A0A4Z1T8C3_GIAMU|nr:Peptidyl-tRNA hydrolase [Giardia muris]|eukprot:TNJ30373.1 Peptidyl-tRNA hydrolase [Giardia muris]